MCSKEKNLLLFILELSNVSILTFKIIAIILIVKFNVFIFSGDDLTLSVCFKRGKNDTIMAPTLGRKLIWEPSTWFLMLHSCGCNNLFIDTRYFSLS